MAENDEILDEDFDEEMEPEIIQLVDKDGKDVDFYHLATIDYKEEWYVILQPVEEEPDIADDEVLIFRLGINKEDGTDTFEPIEDEEVLQAVFDEYLAACEEDECDCNECSCDCQDCDCDHDCDCDEDCDCENCDSDEDDGNADKCKCCCDGE